MIRRALKMASAQVDIVVDDMEKKGLGAIRVSGVTGALSKALKISDFATELADAWEAFDTFDASAPESEPREPKRHGNTKPRDEGASR